MGDHTDFVQDSMFDHDLGHMCRGSKQFRNVLRRLRVHWWSCCDIHRCGRHLGRGRTLCEYSVGACIVFHRVTSEYNLAFVLRILWFQLRIFEMTDFHQRSKMDCSMLFFCFQNNLCFALYFGHMPGQELLELPPFLPTAAFASGVFIARCMDINL